jgi:hypothetical protein
MPETLFSFLDLSCAEDFASRFAKPVEGGRTAGGRESFSQPGHLCGRPGLLQMDISSLLIQLVSGALGGNAAGAYSKDTGLSPIGNTIVGALGGGVGGQILSALLGLGGTAAASGLDIGSIVSAFATGGVSGGLTALVVGYLKSRFAT